MKILILILSLNFVASVANAADCYDVVETQYKKLLEDGYTFDSLQDVDKADALDKINESTEIEDKTATLKIVMSDDVLLYLGYSSQGGGSAEEILVADQKTCGITHRFYTYVE